MRVFVTGTGRCGTTTFAKACSHITNYTSGHETHWRPSFDNSKVREYADGHIESDPHLVWHIGVLANRYPDAWWVHLVRERESCVRSLAKTMGVRDWARLAYVGQNDVQAAASDFYDFVNQTVPLALAEMQCITMHLERLKEEWYLFWNLIGAEGDYEASVRELGVRHNAR